MDVPVDFSGIGDCLSIGVYIDVDITSEFYPLLEIITYYGRKLFTAFFTSVNCII